METPSPLTEVPKFPPPLIATFILLVVIGALIGFVFTKFLIIQAFLDRLL